MSVFTFETEPVRVSSPWLHQPGETPDQPLTKLQAEPQEGPTEYKLHLLLRPRRAYQHIKVGSVSNSQQVCQGESAALNYSSASFNGSSSDAGPSNVISASGALLANSKHRVFTPESFSTTTESRRDRLHHLTTQLLWRLQQSTRYKPLGKIDTLIPEFPDDNVDLAAAVKPGHLWQGLEDSRGALYEIGVADDGTLVGLPEDEVDESLLTLKVMAASLGCVVEVTRRKVVGDCEWMEKTSGEQKPIIRQDKLWVVEAFVKPSSVGKGQAPENVNKSTPLQTVEPVVPVSTTDQLRVTLTGPTTCGKSTLLGTLSTGTRDNGSGSSRTFMHKHRHELASGMTTSVSHMLIGYKNNGPEDNLIFNFSDPNVEGWEGIHDSSRDGRLVFVSDSAGHLRYRRTLLRGLIGWAPHWTVLCLAADNTDTKGNGASSLSSGLSSPPTVEVDLASAHLDLCLKLRLPLVIVITKLDLATSASIRSMLGKVLTAVKNAGRVPMTLTKQKTQPDPTRIPAQDEEDIRPIISSMTSSGNLLKFVPLVVTSAVKGWGFGVLHALLQNLPIPPTPTAQDYIGMALNPEQPDCLFHFEEKFSLPASYGNSVKEDEEADLGTVVAGYLRFGRLSVGDRVVVGPFPCEEDESRTMTPDDRTSPGREGFSVSHTSASELSRIAMRNAVPASTIKGEWHNAHIVTIRNLRLPVKTLQPGQAGTVGIVFQRPDEDLTDSIFENPPRLLPKIRKGMVLAMPSKHMRDSGLSLQAASGITALFEDTSTSSLIVGSIVNIYVASVRATARILRVSPTWPQNETGRTAGDNPDHVFSLSEEQTSDQNAEGDPGRMFYEVQLELLTHREWIELGSQVVILEGGSKDRSGLESFVGKVVEIIE